MSVSMTMPAPYIGTVTMEALRFILASSLTEKPKRCLPSSMVASINNLAWVFVTDASFLPVAVRTYSTLEAKLPRTSYFTGAFFLHHADCRMLSGYGTIHLKNEVISILLLKSWLKKSES